MHSFHFLKNSHLGVYSDNVIALPRNPCYKIVYLTIDGILELRKYKVRCILVSVCIRLIWKVSLSNLMMKI